MSLPYIVPSKEIGLVWRCTGLIHLSPAENAGKHNIFIEAILNGSIIRDGSVKVGWSWTGQHPDEVQPLLALEKKAPDLPDIPINAGQHIELAIADRYPSDRVVNLNAELPSDGPGNDWQHHSWHVTFELLGDAKPPEQSLEERVAALETWRVKIERDLQIERIIR